MFGMRQRNSETQPVNNRHWGFSTAGRVFFGWGVLEELRTVGKEFGKRVMVCCDKNLIKSGITDKVETLLKEGGAEVLLFSEGRPDINLQLIGECAEAARAFKPDVMIGLGGGSNMDLAKTSAIQLKYGGPLTKYYGEHNV